jgi:hypothetical protein
MPKHNPKECVECAERAVVEAAKALDFEDLLYDARMERDFTTEQRVRLRNFEDAVEALQAAEEER